MNDAIAFNLLAIDPGSVKCGLAVLNQQGKVLLREISPSAQIAERITALVEQWNILHIVYGRSTGSKTIRQLLTNLVQSEKSTFETHGVDERNSTLEARTLYWQEHPRSGLQRLLPISLLAPPEPVDDFAAVVLGHRFLNLR